MSDEEISINDLVTVLDDTNEYGDLKRMAEQTVKPLQETSEAASKRAALSANYEIAKENVSAWAPVVNEVQSNRTISFENDDDKLQFNSFTPIKTELGSEIDAILEKEKLTRESQQTLEDEAMAHLSEEEMRMRVEQLAKLRSLQFYNEQKAKRWKKIKSKTFKRLHKKDMADISLEELAEVDPEAFQARLKKIEAERAKERATLRHKNTSQWVRRVLARGLKSASEDVRKQYEEQLRLGEELTKKIQGFGQSDDDEEEKPLPENPVQTDKKLSKLFNMKFMREAEERKQKEFEELEKAFNATGEAEQVPSTGIVNIKPILENNVQQEKVDTQKQESSDKPKAPETPEPTPQADDKQEAQETTEKEETNPWLQKKRPKRRFVTATSFHQPTPDELRAAEDRLNLSKKEEQREIMADAFGLTEEFQKEKEAQAAKEAEKDLPEMDSLFIEGWGSWVGPDGVESEGAKRRRQALESKRNKIIEEALRERKDAKMPHVMIHEGQDIAVSKYSVPDVPRFYANAKQLEAQMKYPIGPEFNSVSGYETLIQPNMRASFGHVIDPIFFTKMQKLKEKRQKRNAARKALEASKLSK